MKFAILPAVFHVRMKKKSTLLAVFHVINKKKIRPPYPFIRTSPFIKHLRVKLLINTLCKNISRLTWLKTLFKLIRWSTITVVRFPTIPIKLIRDNPIPSTQNTWLNSIRLGLFVEVLKQKSHMPSGIRDRLEFMIFSNLFKLV